MIINNIPNELKEFRQFVCWKLEDRDNTNKPTKIPYCPHTGRKASVTDPNTWGSFEDALASCELIEYSGIGFVLSENDPFTFIDLDETSNQIDYQRQIDIFNKFDSYSEISPSGKGLHIIVKGKVSSGRKRSSVEIYSSERYMTMTGNVYNNKAISTNQELLDILWEEMGSNNSKFIQHDGNAEQKYSDAEIIEMAKTAVNGNKFNALLSDEWKTIYPSQSEADQSFINIIGFYTQNKEQIERIFHNSYLGQRDKAKSKYHTNRMISKSFDNQPPIVNLDALNGEITQMIKEEKEKKIKKIKPDRIASDETDITYKVTFPKGLVGDIANYIYATSNRQCAEVALAGSLALMAGICGRSYNVSGTGLNLYLLLIAKTGRGKDAIVNGTDNLMNYICQKAPTAKDFIGPAAFASGQGLVQHFNDNPLKSSYSVFGEFGIKLAELCDPRALGPTAGLKQMYLDFFHKSGKNSSYKPTAYSKKDNNIPLIKSPALTIIGEGTPESIYDNLNEHTISSGMLPRFITIEYLGDRMYANKNTNVIPSNELLTHLLSVVGNSLTLTASNVVNNVLLTDEAQKIIDNFDIESTDKINNSPNDSIAELWNRSHLKALKLAALISVGINENFPCIDLDTIIWAIDFIKADIKRMSWRFEKGKIGKPNDDNAQISKMSEAIKEYTIKSYDEYAKKYDNSKSGKTNHSNGMITYSYLSKRLTSDAKFKSDKLGATAAIKKCIQSLIDIGLIVEIPKHQATKDFGTTGRLFKILDREQFQ